MYNTTSDKLLHYKIYNEIDTEEATLLRSDMPSLEAEKELADKSVSNIEAEIKRGETVYANTQKSIKSIILPDTINQIKNGSPVKNNAKIVGTIIAYNGSSGIITHNNEKYYFSNKDLYSKYLEVGDTVEFYKNKLPFGDETILMARYIENTNKIEDNNKKGKQ